MLILKRETTKATMNRYKLFKGFKKLGEFKTILAAKKNSPKKDGVYNLIDSKGSYRSSWQYLNGVYYGD